MASMAHLTLGDGGGPEKVLCLGAHCDDIENWLRRHTCLTSQRARAGWRFTR